MRLWSTILNDIRYQMKYGFYFLYAFMTILYIVILNLVPMEHKSIIASIILLSDPAALGFFFVGGIWLLEKGEGIHRFYLISPLRSVEYCLGKMISLAIISTLSGVLIATIAIPLKIDFVFLSLGMFLGSGIFTFLGLFMATYAKSVNHYMIINVLPGTLMIAPAILAAFGIHSTMLELFPATMLWHVIELSISNQTIGVVYLLGLLIWLILGLIAMNYRISTALLAEGGE